MSYQIKIPSCIFGGAGSIENVKAVIENENSVSCRCDRKRDHQ